MNHLTEPFSPLPLTTPYQLLLQSAQSGKKLYLGFYHTFYLDKAFAKTGLAYITGLYHMAQHNKEEARSSFEQASVDPVDSYYSRQAKVYLSTLSS